MSKISTYEVVPVPKLADKLIGTSVGGEVEDATYNFTLQELLDLFIPLMPANNLQGILDFGNTATQDINLFGTITTTYLDVTDTANLYITYLNEETHIVGSVFDSLDLVGTSGQVLTSTGEGVEWVTLPPIFTPNLQQVLEVGNTADIDIVLDANIQALDVSSETANVTTQLTIQGVVMDYNESVGTAGQVLSSTATTVEWVSLPVYSATSPLLFNPATGVFSIQQATNSQNGYLSSSDWITFDGKQNAGNYITALTGEATASGPGSAIVTLSNSAVIGKVLTGFNPTAGTINASDSILTAFGKTQSQINALVGGVQYQGVWNASTNVPTLVSSVGVQGHYYVVNVAGNTNLNGITDWQVGDWAIFSESVWQKVDNTDSVTSVNGFTGAVSLTTDNIPEGTTNLYFLNSRARTALSFAAGSGAYNNVTGVITIPTDNNQILNGAGYITLGSLSANAPLTYNPLTGVFNIPKATTSVDGYLSATDWTTFNNKQNYLGGTGLVKSTAGTITYITDNSGNWNTAYDRSIVSAAVTGTTTKTLTLNEQDGSTITASWTDLDTGLTSVGVSMPSAFSVANSPLTSNGTIAITGAGTSLQYIDGTGALQTFPGLTGFVPYTGATTNVNLGTYGLISDYLQLNNTPTSVPTTAGTMSWNNSDGTMDIRLKGGNVTLQVGEETVVRVVNKSGVDLLEANYQVVRVRNEAEGGAQGQRLAVVLARANTKVNHTGLLGIVTETINSNQEGFVTNFGIVRDIDTTGDLQGETWADGDVLWLSETTAGALTNVEPTTHPVQIGYVTYAHANNGKIFVYLQEGVDELDELHDVSITSVTNNQGLFYDSATSLWKNKSIATALGYTPADAATTLTINGTTYDLSANRTWSVGTVTSVAALTLGTTGTDLSSTVATGTTTPVITLNVPTASAANRGALSAADWSTFNNKVGSVTASTPLASSGGSTPNITIQQSSGSQDGYLSSTDWTTFNNKQASGNYITSLTGEATGTGPGATAVTLNNASVTAKVLTGINITGGTVQATDTMLTAFGKLQNQINGLIGSTIYQGTWNASTNTPALASGVGVRGYYYIVSVAGNTNLDGITDWFVGDWAIFDGTAWQQVDNTDAVVSVNGQTGAVSLTTDNIPEGATNQYFLNSRARAALSFTAGSGAYNSTTGVITIPTNTSQLTNGANYITLASLSGVAPIQYNSSTGAISITQAGTSSNGFLSSTDWNTFNNKQGALTNPVTGTGSSGQVTYFNGTTSVTGSSVFFWDATNNRLGIGLNNPQRTLEIHNPTADSQLRISGSAPSVSLGEAITGAIYQAKFGLATANGQYAAGAVAGDFVIISQTGATIFSTSSTEKMRVQVSGNVSIGNTNDTYKLDVTGTGRFTSNLYTSTALYIGTTAAYGFKINSEGNNGFYNRGGSTTGHYPFLLENSSGALLFQVQGTGAATFSSSVAVGTGMTIGTSGTNDIVWNTAGGIKLSRTNVGPEYALSQRWTGSLAFVDIASSSQWNGGVCILPNGGGNVGIGTTSPTVGKLVVLSSDTTISMFGQNIDSSTTIGNSFVGRFRNGFDGNGLYSLVSFQVQNASGVDQVAFIGAQSVSGASNYQPNTVFGVRNGASTYTEYMRITSGGNLLLQSGVTVYNDSGDFFLRAGTSGTLILGAGGTNGYMRITSGGNAIFSGGNFADVNNTPIRVPNNKFLTFYNAADTGWAFTMGANDDNSGGIGGLNGIQFSTGGSLNLRMRITSDGNVGLGGITNPQTQLQLNGTITFSEAGFNTVRLNQIASQHSDGSSQNNFIRFLVSNGSGTTAERMRINGLGWVGINGTNPVQTLDVSGAIRSGLGIGDGSAIARAVSRTLYKVMVSSNYDAGNAVRAGEWNVLLNNEGNAVTNTTQIYNYNGQTATFSVSGGSLIINGLSAGNTVCAVYTD